MAPYVGYLRWERGSWMISPKTVLSARRSAGKNQSAGMARGTGTRRAAKRGAHQLGPAAALGGSFGGATHSRPGLLEHLAMPLRSWPWPLMLLSASAGRRGAAPCSAPLLMEAGLPLLAVPFDPRFQPAGGAGAGGVRVACGGSWLAGLLASRPRVRLAAAAAVVGARGARHVLGVAGPGRPHRAAPSTMGR
jgi:hypothetical protein